MLDIYECGYLVAELKHNTAELEEGLHALGQEDLAEVGQTLACLAKAWQAEVDLRRRLVE